MLNTLVNKLSIHNRLQSALFVPTVVVARKGTHETTYLYNINLR